MAEAICPSCGRENDPKNYQDRPMRILTGEVTHKSFWTCIMCGWEFEMSWWNKWWWVRYEKNLRKRASRAV